MSALGDAIRDGLRDTGLTQVRLADMLGATINTVNRWVRGRSVPGPADAGILAQLLGRPEIETIADQTRSPHSAAQSRIVERRRATMPPRELKPKAERKTRRTLDVWSLRPPARNATHTIEDIRFAPGAPAEHAPMSCRCGWSGTTGDWMDHRREVAA